MKLTGVGSKRAGHILLFIDGVEQEEMTWLEAVEFGQMIVVAANRSCQDVDASVQVWVEANTKALHRAQHVITEHSESWPGQTP